MYILGYDEGNREMLFILFFLFFDFVVIDIFDMRYKLFMFLR